MENYHSHDVKSIIEKLKSGKNGLSSIEAEKRLQKNGLNEIPKEKTLGAFKIFISQFNNSLVYILLFAGALSLFLGERVDAGVIFSAVFINVIIGFFQENKASQAIAKLRQLVEHKAFVLRDGQEKMVLSAEVVIGDILIIKAGNRIAADARIIESADLEINESGLTGESLPASKNIKIVFANAVLADRGNMVYAGTLVVRGQGRAIVCATGRNTEIGKIAALVNETKEEKTPLQLRLGSFSRTLGLIFSLICFRTIWVF